MVVTWWFRGGFVVVTRRTAEEGANLSYNGKKELYLSRANLS